MSSRPFDTGSLGGVLLKNRLVRSAAWEGMAQEDGLFCTPALVGLIGDLAKGEVGLIISGYTSVSPEGQAGPRRLAAPATCASDPPKTAASTVLQKGGSVGGGNLGSGRCG